MKINVTPVFEKNYDAINQYDIIVNQGGTRSSKTYSIAQLWIIKLLSETNKTLDIIRKTLPACRGSVMRDFFEILITLGLYDSKNHNRTENTYKLNDNLVSFIGLDDPQKVRGRKRSYLWLNEGNEMRYEDWKQLKFRTEEKTIIDFNPSDEFHWIYDKVMTRDDVCFIKSTYKDNPFLNDQIIAEIERLKNEDPDYWRVYGLGERGASRATIFPKWDIYNHDLNNIDDWCFGMDFGHTAPAALVYVGFKEKDLYWDEIIYQDKLNNSQLIDLMNKINYERPNLMLKTKAIYCDHAEPKTIDELYMAGFNAKKANKSNFSHAVRTIKSFNIHISKNSHNMQKEIKFYKHKEDRDGNILEEQVKFNDHSMDACRYGTYTYLHDRTEPMKAKNYDWA